MKKFIVLILVFFVVLFIYIVNIDDKVYYLALGDSYSLGMTPYNGYDYGFNDYVKDYLENNNKLEEYIKDFSKSGYRTIDLLRDIEDNKTISIKEKELSIQQALIKADLVTLSIGTNDIINISSISVDNSYVSEAMNDMESLLSMIRKYCKEKIIAVGYLTKNETYEYASKKYKQLCEKYDIIYIDSSELLNDSKYFPNPNNIHPSKEGYEKIANKIIQNVKF